MKSIQKDLQPNNDFVTEMQELEDYSFEIGCYDKRKIEEVNNND